ncbi:MAG: branched-chain amino acid ABC transporter permease [Thermofilum sp.]|uniref:ABC transporter permease n=1 Tax=Thermofilum adornatum TaxID=1365176 RepID=S5ZXW8_9CREN|nr:branched-chain amino acid ABC transporter permease [Thermofilum adornatum]AGT36259.1 ABC transporter permease [Thermofilum adornatum]
MIDVVGFLISWLTFLGIYGILAVSLNFESGTSGVTNFGKVFFYGLGAYIGAALTVYLFLLLSGVDTSKVSPFDIEGIVLLGELATKNPILDIGLLVASLVLAFLVAGIVGYLLSYPIIRVGPAFVGFTLLSTGELFRIFVQHYEPLGGSKGIMSIPHPFAWVPNPTLRALLYLFIVLALLALTYFVFRRLYNSPLGRTLRAVRDDEIAALCLGKHVPRLKAMVLFIGSGFAGMAGVLLAFYYSSINPDIFVPAVTFNVWAMIILGGMGNLEGSLLGAAIFTLFDRLLAFVTPQLGITIISPDYIRGFLVGFLIVVVLLFRPQGILKEGKIETPAWKVYEEEVKGEKSG